VDTIGTPEMVPPGIEPPQAGNFGEWSYLIANYLASGRRAAKIRAHLKGVADTAWPLVSWLVHDKKATRNDAEIAIIATESVVTAYSSASARYEGASPERCGVCDSYRLATDYRPDESPDDPWVTLCASCGAILIQKGDTGPEVP
jgi:hypothetical protein